MIIFVILLHCCAKVVRHLFITIPKKFPTYKIPTNEFFP